MERRIKVLVVDDSSFARSTIVAKLTTDPEIEIAGQARDGIEAVEKVKELKPAVVTMDVTMPRMDGLVALDRIMVECPTPVVMLSALTAEGAEATVRALELGAIDFFLKPSIANPAGVDKSTSDLITKIKVASKVKVSRRRKAAVLDRVRPRTEKPVKRRSTRIERVVVIGSSTGGPQALSHVIPELPGDIPALILIVQHMPQGFTRSLADRLDQLSQLDVKEAQEGDQIGPGLVLLAPGDYHMIVNMNGKIGLNQGPPECGVRPSVNLTMEAVARIYGSSAVGVVLTGMGSDGTRGASLIKAGGGRVIVEDESTCAVYGMPASVVAAGKADSILPRHKIAGEIVRICQEKVAISRRKQRVGDYKR
jgi:two-component system chemotaxis response regulator CheB